MWTLRAANAEACYSVSTMFSHSCRARGYIRRDGLVDAVYEHWHRSNTVLHLAA